MIAAAGQPELEHCERSVRAHAGSDIAIVVVEPSSEAVNRALAQLAPADVTVLSEPCLVSEGWLERMRADARADSNTATASALADRGRALAIEAQGSAAGGDPAPPGEQEAADRLARLSEQITTGGLALRPRLSAAAGPCVYVRREALELVGGLDEELDLRWALEVDFAQRCVLAGLSHVAADDVVVARLSEQAGACAQEPPAVLAERYPYLASHPPLGGSAVLTHALEAVRGCERQLSVTIDARALDGSMTGTHVHVLELILALARTEQLRMRLLVRMEQIDAATLGLLQALPATEILAAEQLDAATPRTTIFHRPQQTFTPGDVALALALGERLVLSQLDLIAYRNPGYFADGETWQDYRRASRHGLSAAERVVVFSEHTRRELISDALVDDARIRVVAPGLDHRAAGEPSPPRGLDDGLEGFLLCLGTDFRHKNRVFALRLLAALREQHGWQGSLVLAGTHIPTGSSLELEREFLERHDELRAAVVSLGAVDEREKAWLLARAGAVVYPSVYEGFGLVPFESALSGVPCAFAPQASLAEEAPPGSATIVPWSERESAAAVYALLTDAQARARHVEELAAAARELSWTKAAEAMVEIYRQAARAPVRDAATLARDAVAREDRLSVEHRLETARRIREREHAQRMYDELNSEVGFGLSLIGPHGTLPEGLQRALLAISARPAISRPLFGALSRCFLAARVFARLLRARDTRRSSR